PVGSSTVVSEVRRYAGIRRGHGDGSDRPPGQASSQSVAEGGRADETDSPRAVVSGSVGPCDLPLRPSVSAWPAGRTTCNQTHNWVPIRQVTPPRKSAKN